MQNISFAGKCVAPTCTDGRKNGTESDLDCGGPISLVGQHLLRRQMGRANQDVNALSDPHVPIG